MPAVVESLFSTNKIVPWHGLGVILNNPPSISEGLKLSGLDWNVQLKDLQTVDKESVSHKAVCRIKDGKVLGVVGPKYSPLQNQDAFKWFEPFVDSKEVSLETAGSLSEGQKVWILARINRPNSEILKGDEVAKYLMLSNSHDGTMAVRVGFTPVRICCLNTLAYAISHTKSKLLRVKHSASVKQNLDNIRETINVINQEFEATAAQYKLLANKGINDKDIKKYVRVLFEVDHLIDDKISTRSKNMMNRVIELMDIGKGSDITGVSGTWWGTYNAYSEWLNWEYGRSNNNRMNMVWFGNKNKKALDLALTLIA